MVEIVNYVKVQIRIAYMIIGILGGCIVLIVSFCNAFDIREENKL